MAVPVWYLLVGIFALCGCPYGEATPLTEQILHYEALSYDTGPVLDGHNRLKRSAGGDSNSKKLDFSITALGRYFPMTLWPSRRVFMPGAKFEYVSSDGSRRSVAYDMDTFYEGKVNGDPSSHVSGHIIDGVFDGTITLLGEKYHVENSGKFFNSADEKETEKAFHSVIYRESDVVYQPAGHNSSCGAKDKLLKELNRLQSTAVPLKRTTAEDNNGGTLTEQLNNAARKNKEKGERGRGKGKRAFTQTGGAYCHVLVAADDLFVQNVAGGSETAAMVEIGNVFSEVQSIYGGTDFDSQGGGDGISPVIALVEFLSPTEPGFASSLTISVNNFLDLWSQRDQESYCLAILLTYRDFEGGVLGLAWVAEPPGGNRGGICEERITLAVGERSLNTAIVTYLNYGQRQPRPVLVVTVAHEFGHNFGSDHDMSSDCTPGSSNGGNYIMFPSATNGDLPNNRRFSPCSRASMYAVLLTKSGCFEADAAFCGNSVVEEDEDCDCGSEDLDRCAEVDPCCTTECTLRDGAECSISQDCCNDNCMFRPNGTRCRDGNECREPAFCNGEMGACPKSVSNEGTCNEMKNLCEDGVCSGSVCRANDLEDCECEEEEKQCVVCCLLNTTCISSLVILAPTRGGANKSPGSSCNNFEGYCSNQNPPECRVVDNEDVLEDLLDIFTLDKLNEFAVWLLANWYIPVAVIVGIMILLCLLHVTYRKRKPVKKAVRRARNSIRGRHEGGGAANATDGPQSASNNPRGITPREGLNRLNHFFPTADSETIMSVMRNSSNETKAVKRMLELGYPLKKVPIPTNRV